MEAERTRSVFIDLEGDGEDVRWQRRGDGITPLDDEDTVDDLFDKVSHPHQLAPEADDGAAGGETMGEIFVAADRLQDDPDDKQGTRSLLGLDEALDPEAPPYGLGAPEWKHVCERVEALAELLRADVLDEEAAIESARDLRNALRPFV